MSDVDARERCPERGCGLSLNEEEMFAHLKWDHNYAASQARRRLGVAFEDPDGEVVRE